ncbi:GTP cyclohydrolase II RibA [Salinisphaera sp.]|uniref:GTP cyclohydrolase II RibA n=1 Tax=Salinisphaera sp. TaxID=1914330 RepID=UPI002D786094|nr:GTP cyclohydrolase II RibA [Salinisphaera sp.]HET7313981.1 GTP cyclohydrolase II RibA [Salinisphaera sp.]
MIAQHPESIQDRFMQHVERAILDLRRGLPVVVDTPHRRYLVASLEGTTAALLDELQKGARGAPQLVVTEHRLAHLGRERPPAVAAIELAASDSRDDLIRWAAEPDARWPEARATYTVHDAGHAAIALMRRALLLPAAILAEPDESLAPVIQRRLERGDLLSVTAADVFAHRRAAPSLLRRVSEADVPLEAAPNARFVVFREADGMREHVAIVIGDSRRWADPVPVRLHSACLTGDLFGSLRCDCGPQLKASVAAIHARGGGVLLYLAQEGRGIGLTNKLRAYQMQDDGLDTVDADHVLGFSKDERDYAVAREMLAQIGVDRIDLLTNNPAKIEAMNREPIEVVGRSGVYGRLTPHNRRYLTTKAERAGHWLDALLAEPFDSNGSDL